MGRIRNLWVFLGLALLAVSFCDLRVNADVIPSENECRPYIEKAIHELKNVEPTAPELESTEASNQDESASLEEPASSPETIVDDPAAPSIEESTTAETQSDETTQSQENQTDETVSGEEQPAVAATEEQQEVSSEEVAQQSAEGESAPVDEVVEQIDGDLKEEESAEESQEQPAAASESEIVSDEAQDATSVESSEQAEAAAVESEEKVDEQSAAQEDVSVEEASAQTQEDESTSGENVESQENASVEETGAGETDSQQDNQSGEEVIDDESTRAKRSIDNEEAASVETQSEAQEEVIESEENSTVESTENAVSDETVNASENIDTTAEESTEAADAAAAPADESVESSAEVKEASVEETSAENKTEESNETVESKSEEVVVDAEKSAESVEEVAAAAEEVASVEEAPASVESTEEPTVESTESVEEPAAPVEPVEEATAEDLTLEFEIPKNLRPHDHVDALLGLNGEAVVKEAGLRRTGDVILKELKKIYDNAVKPLETLYKYRDLSNRHFGDPEIFSKPLVLFMGPWSGGKSTILNYLTNNEYTPDSIRSGAEPSPAHFNILMHGDEPEVLDGTQLAADWTFSGLQKFGQGLMDRLRGQKLPNKLLERVNIVEIPGILEVRKQVSRYFPFNDACQWFIDRADIIFLVYDPSKLDVGPETEAILDQLKGREYQTRILLNKADQVKPEELLRVQGALIWNISPLMSSAQPPVMYTVSLWSHPYETGAPVRLLQAQERAFLADLREAIDKRIENKIASARRFAVRIRNHAKMVDCYLTTYYNQKGLFSNKKAVSDKIIENPQNYNIYEGLSTLTNISRYDLPDPEVYLDFFRLNPLFEFKKLADTCTYFSGCPINKLDIAIAYDLPELVGKYKKLLEQNLIQLRKEYDENCNQTDIDTPVKIAGR